MTKALLTIIAIAALAIAGLYGYNTYETHKAKHTTAWLAQYKEAKSEAEFGCTLGGVVPGMTGLDDPAYLNCVKREAAAAMGEWEQSHPDDH